MRTIVKKLIEERPFLHMSRQGTPVSWSSNEKLLVMLDNYVKSGMHTIETGSGYSTIIFANNGCYHTCITPAQNEVDNIKDYCRKEDIDLNKTDFKLGDSTEIMPSLSITNLDLTFIYGAHRFPFPFIDWFYFARFLREDGLMVIDDTDIISCHILMRFMLNDSHWGRVEIKDNYAVFRKLASPLGIHNYDGDWPAQPFSIDKIINRDDILRNLYSESKSGS